MNTKTRRIFAVRTFLLAALFTGSAAPVLAASVTIRVPALEAEAGGTLELPVEVADNPGLGAVHVEITYDASALKAEEVVAGPILKSALLDFNVKKPGRVTIGIATSGGVKGDGAIALVRFSVLEQAAGKSPVGLEKCRAWDDSDQELEILVKTVAGELTIGTGAASGGSSWLLLAGGTAAVLLVGIVLVVVAVRSRKRRPASPQAVRPQAVRRTDPSLSETHDDSVEERQAARPPATVRETGKPAAKGAPTGPKRAVSRPAPTGPYSGPALRLVMESGDTPGGATEMGRTVHIGRSEKNDIVLSEQSLSGFHAKIERVNEGYRLTDLHSKNGTFLNGERVAEPVFLQPGDKIRIGRTVFRCEAAAALRRPMPPATLEVPAVGTCAHCGAVQSEEGELFCGECGKPLIPPAEVKCAKCGAPIPAQKKFCTKCGTPRSPGPGGS